MMTIFAISAGESASLPHLSVDRYMMERCQDVHTEIRQRFVLHHIDMQSKLALNPAKPIPETESA